MRRLGILAVALVLALSGSVRAQEKDARKLAQEILDKGAALFDTRDATAMAATYTEEAQIQWIERDDSTGEIKVSIKKDRTEIESLYRDLFKDSKEKTTSKNIVEFARFVGSNVMIIQGDFQPNVAKEGKFAFVQMRVKQGEKWLIKNLQLFVISQDS